MKKQRVETPSCLTLSVSLWFELILKPHVDNLEDLISFKRLSKAFAAYTYLNEWIKRKEEMAFGGGIEKKYWNRYAQTEMTFEAEDRFMEWHPDKLILFVSYKPRERAVEDNKKLLGIYHCKEYLLRIATQTINTLARRYGKGYWKPAWNGQKYCFQENLAIVYVQGVDFSKI
jgi:hypothetical protein